MNLCGKTTGQLLDVWEARRAIKNRMGYLSYYGIVKKNNEIFDTLWSKRDDICLGINTGWYAGRDAVAGYYKAKTTLETLTGQLFKEAFPTVLGEKSDEEVYGTGTMEYLPVECELVEVAEDMQTAKGLWVVRGSVSKVTPAGPVGYWEWGWYAVDFVHEDDEWKIWHMQYLTDVDAVCGTNWIESGKEYPENKVFESIKAFSFPAPNRPACLRELYSPSRPFTQPPAMPEPYRTFSETFSYGC